MTELLYDGLAEHILLELTSCISTLSEKWTNEISSSVKESVVILMEATGVTDLEDMSSMSLDKLLERFFTGTEKAKAWGQRGKLSKSSAQGPIDMLYFESPTKTAKALNDRNKAIQNRDKENIKVPEDRGAEV